MIFNNHFQEVKIQKKLLTLKIPGKEVLVNINHLNYQEIHQKDLYPKAKAKENKAKKVKIIALFLKQMSNKKNKKIVNIQ